MMFNKLLIIHHNNADAAVNFFVLQKDALVIESQLVVYGSLELADAFADFKDIIANTPNDQFLQKWTEIYNKGHECLLKCRKALGSDISENFKEFSRKLTIHPPSSALFNVVTNCVSTPSKLASHLLTHATFAYSQVMMPIDHGWFV